MEGDGEIVARKLERADIELDAKITSRVVESLATRGDISALSPEERSLYYVQTCESLGLNPATQPFAILRLNGKEVLYPTRGATDQLAAIHRLNRRITDGPRELAVGGTKLVYAVCEATHPNGRVETATAMVPMPAGNAEAICNAYLKCETKARRRATLSILGLGMLDETELDTIPAAAKAPAPPIDARAGNDRETLPPPPPDPATPPTALDRLLDDLTAVETREQLRAVWHEHRAAVAQMDAAGEDAVIRQAREACWQCASSQGLARTKKELAEILAGRDPQPPPPKGGKRPSAPPAADPDATAERAAIEATDARPAARSAEELRWRAKLAEQNAHPIAVAECTAKHIRARDYALDEATMRRCAVERVHEFDRLRSPMLINNAITVSLAQRARKQEAA